MNMQPADYSKRALAYIIDVFFILIPGIVGMILGIAMLFGIVTIGGGIALLFLSFLWLLVAGFWNDVWRQGKTGATFGKSRMELRLVRLGTNEPVGVGSALVRMLAVWFFNVLTGGLYLIADLLAPAFTERKQRITDKLLSLEVVDARGGFLGSTLPPPPPPESKLGW